MTAARDHNDRSRRVGYEGPRSELQELVPADAANVLELGCSVGALGAAIKERRPTRILGVEISEELAARARGRLDRVVVGDAEEFLAGPPPPEAPFDCLVCADVLEHLVDPWQALRRAVALLRPGGVAVVSLPNVFYWATLLPALVARRWPREPEGIFDATHLRWFGRGDATDLLSGAGLVDVEVRPSYWSAPSRKRLVRLLGRTFLRDYLAAQFLATGAVPQPGAGSSAVT